MAVSVSVIREYAVELWNESGDSGVAGSIVAHVRQLQWWYERMPFGIDGDPMIITGTERKIAVLMLDYGP